VSARLMSSDSDDNNAILPASQLEGRVQAEVDEQMVQRVLSSDKPQSQPHVDLEEIADKVYRLMQHDLILERERATKVGG